jgi:hypothetical protein
VLKLRAALGILAVAVTLAACGNSAPPGGSSGGGGGVVASNASSSTGADPADMSASGAGAGGGSAFCTNLVTAEQRLSNIEQSVSGGDLDEAKTAIDAQIGTFQRLSKGAPDSVRPALQDIVQILTTAKSTLVNPSNPDAAGIQALGTQLPGDLAALGNYVANNCQGN